MPFPPPKSGPLGYFCPRCRRRHLRNSTVGHLHKVYLEIDRQMLGPRRRKGS